MQYQFTERYELVKTIEFKNSNPLHVKKIRFFKEEEISGTFLSKEYRYSFDNAVWTNWNTLTQSNLANIEFRDRLNFWLQIKYTRTAIGAGNILRWYLFYDEIGPTPPAPSTDASIDADTLQGEGPEYYLNRENHFGPYTDLIVENVVDGSSAGVYYGRQDSSLGTTLYFKRIEGELGVTVTDTSDGKIIIGIDASIASGGFYESSLDPSISMPNTVGGIPAGTKVYDLNGDTISSLWDALLFPAAYPSLTGPSGTFNINLGATLYEVSTNISPTFTTNFSRGSISPQYTATSPYRSGTPNNYDFTGTGLVDVSSSSLSNAQTIPSYYIKQGNQTWSANVSYNAGVQPYDSKGNIYNTPLPAGSISAGSKTLEGVYPLYATTVNITTLTKQTLVSMLTGNQISFNMVPESGGNKQTFEIPNLWLLARPLVGVQTYNALTLQWEYQGGTAPISLTYWTTSADNQTIQGYLIPYTKYTFNGVDRSSIPVRLVF
jgi:hypothetical protein